MVPDEFTRAGERVREQIAILGELRNAGPRDQRFKLWRQNTLTLLQRLWPGQAARAERFRRIPFSAPLSRSDRESTRQYFERGCKEAVTYLNSIATELGAEAVSVGDEMPERAEETTVVAPDAEPATGRTEPPAERPMVSAAPRAAEPEPEPAPATPEPVAQAPMPALAGPDPATQTAPAPEPPRRAAPPRTPKPEYENLPISFLNRKPAADDERRAPVAPPPEPVRPAVPSAPVHPAAESAWEPAVVEPTTGASAPPPVPEATAPAARDTAPPPAAPRKTVGMRLKDMLGFTDHGKIAEAEATPDVAPLAAAPRSAGKDVTPARPETVAPPAQAAPGRDLAAEFVLESPVLQARARPLRRVEHPAAAPQEAPRTAAEDAPYEAPAQAGEPVSFEPPSPAETAPVEAAPREAPGPLEMQPVAVPVAQLESPVEDVPPGPARDVYDLAVQVDELGVAAQQRAIMRAALIDLGRQMELPPVHWDALRETVSLAMEHPELARRLMPLVLPYLDEAA